MEFKEEQKETGGLIGTVHIKLADKDGNIKFDADVGKNVITTLGKAAFAGLSGNTGAQVAFTFLAVGTSGTAETAADTTLGSEITDSGLARVAASVSRVTTTTTNDTLQLTTTYTASASKGVQEAGIFNNAVSGGTLGARKTFTVVNVTSTDTLTITYKVQYT